MKSKILLFFTLLLNISILYSQNKNEIHLEIENIKQENLKLQSDYNNLNKDFENLIIQYQQTNDRLNNYLTFTGIIASIFGIFIALAGIYIGFESLKSQKKNKEAIRTLEEAKGYFDDKKSEFDNIIEDKKNLLQNDYDKIVQIFRDKLLTDIELETSKVRELASIKTEEIQNISVEEQNNKTIELLEKRLEFFENVSIPDDPEILFSKAKLIAEKEMHAEAIEIFEKIVKIVPDHKNAYWHLGYEYAILKDLEKSIENYEKHIVLVPKSSSALNNVALKYQDKENYLKALEYFNKAISIDEKKVLYLSNRIKLLTKLNSIEKIIEDYKTLISIDNNVASYYWELIQHLKNENAESEVFKYYDKAINNFKEVLPDISNAFSLNKASYFEKINKFPEAIDILQKLIDDNYKIEECYIKTAELKDKMGKTNEALEILDNGISKNPLSSILYIYKSFIEHRSNSNDSKETLDLGYSKINAEHYYFTSGQFFNQREMYDMADYSYEMVLKATEEKISLDATNEADLMNNFETLIVLRKGTKDFNEKYSTNIKSEKFMLIYDFLTILDNLIVNPTKDNLKSLQSNIKLLNIEAKKIDKLNWNFNDILYSTLRLKNEELQEYLKRSIAYIDGKGELDSLAYNI